jgi:hypothetical protein
MSEEEHPLDDHKDYCIQDLLKSDSFIEGTHYEEAYNAELQSLFKEVEVCL